MAAELQMRSRYAAEPDGRGAPDAFTLRGRTGWPRSSRSVHATRQNRMAAELQKRSRYAAEPDGSHLDSEPAEC